jgi:hypothetical protein
VGGAAPARELETCWRADNDTAPDGTITAGGNDDWGGIASELKAAGGAAATSLLARRPSLSHLIGR